MNASTSKYRFKKKDDVYAGYFSAMASPCEVLVCSDSLEITRDVTKLVAAEAWRIECKYSRYRDDNIIYRINNAGGGMVEVDEETAQLLDFAAKLYELSEGLFDITSGLLRKAWTFDGSDHVANSQIINRLLDKVGWPKLGWQNPNLVMPEDMQIDLGGIGKEYAVDRCIQLIRQHTDVPCLVNFGGDLAVTGARENNHPWQVGIESIEKPGQNSGAVLGLKRGAIATSGDARRFVLKDGKRYGHILNPKTGWPIDGAPRSVTVSAATCTEAGMLATFSMLHGKNCERFLEAEGVKYWCLR